MIFERPGPAFSNKHPMGMKMLIDGHFFRRKILTCKVGQTELIFGVQSRFISRSAQARLQISVCSSYDLYHPG